MTPNRILQLNAFATGATAVAMLAARSFLYPLFGLSSPALLDVIAIAFLGYAAALVAVARQPHVGRGPLMAFTIADGLWVAATIVALVVFWSDMTPIARALIVVTSLVVEVFATLQFRAARTAQDRTAYA